MLLAAFFNSLASRGYPFSRTSGRPPFSRTWKHHHLQSCQTFSSRHHMPQQRWCSWSAHGACSPGWGKSPTPVMGFTDDVWLIIKQCFSPQPAGPVSLAFLPTLCPRNCRPCSFLFQGPSFFKGSLELELLEASFFKERVWSLPASLSVQLPFSRFQLAPGQVWSWTWAQTFPFSRACCPPLPASWQDLPVASQHWRPPFSRLPSGQPEPLRRWQEGQVCAAQTTAFAASPASCSLWWCQAPQPSPCRCCPSPWQHPFSREVAGPLSRQVQALSQGTAELSQAKLRNLAFSSSLWQTNLHRGSVVFALGWQLVRCLWCACSGFCAAVGAHVWRRLLCVCCVVCMHACSKFEPLQLQKQAADTQQKHRWTTTETVSSSRKAFYAYLLC